jgi:hypothetical protein
VLRFSLAAALALPLMAQQWAPIPGAPSTKIYEIHPADAFTGCLGSIAMSSRATGGGNTTGLWTYCPATKAWTMLSNLAVGSFVVLPNGDIVYSQLVPTAQGLTGPSALPITRLPKGGGAPATGIYQGDVRRMGADSTGKIYALQSNGAVFVSIDEVTWTPSNPQTHFTHANSIGGLGVRPSDGAVIVCDEVEPCELWNGSAWAGIGSAPNSGNVVFGPDNSAWSADSNNYPEKWDGVGAWNTVVITPAFRFRMHGAATVGARLCFSGRDIDTNSGPHVYCSSDNGATWTPFEQGINVVADGDNNAMTLATDGTLYMGTDQLNGALYAIPNQGGAPPPATAILTITSP